MNKRGLLGRSGEDLALECLENEGFSLVARNWRTGHYEVDLIVENADSVRIVEVKTLHSGAGFNPVENVSRAKIRNLVSAAKTWFALHPTHKEIIFDVVTVVVDGQEMDVNYIPNAFNAVL